MWQIPEQTVMAVCGVVPVAAMTSVFPFIMHISALLRDHCAQFKRKLATTTGPADVPSAKIHLPKIPCFEKVAG